MLNASYSNNVDDMMEKLSEVRETRIDAQHMPSD